MSDPRICSSADSENILQKIRKFIRGRAHRRKCSATQAPIQCQDMLNSHFELHILPKVSKTVGILAKTHKHVFSVKIFTQRSEFANFRYIERV